MGQLQENSTAVVLKGKMQLVLLLLSALMIVNKVQGFTVSFRTRQRSSRSYSSPLSIKNLPRDSLIDGGSNSFRTGSKSLSSLQSSTSSSQDISTPKNVKNICIVGGGFGGLNTALTLASFPWPEDENTDIKITLLDKKERFVFLPLLYELCVGDAELDEVAPTFKYLLQNTKIEFLQGSLQGVDKDSSCIYVVPKGRDREMKINYDSLVLATGASTNLSNVSGAEKFALPFYTVEDCFELRKRLALIDSVKARNLSDKNVAPTNVVIVGGGYSGVELALNMAERLGGSDNVNVTLVHRGEIPMQYASDFNRKTALDRLERAGVDIMTKTNVVAVCEANEKSDGSNFDMKGKCEIFLEKNQSNSDPTSLSIDADILLWTAGATSTNISKGILNSKLPRDSSGRVVTNSLLCVKDTKNIFALGDCSRSRKIPYGATAAVAMQQAPVVAWNVYSTILNELDECSGDASTKERSLLKFNYVNLGEMMTLGTSDATISSLDGLLELSGDTASVLRRLIYAARMPTLDQAVTAALSSSKNRFSSAFSSLKGKSRTTSTRKR